MGILDNLLLSKAERMQKEQFRQDEIRRQREQQLLGASIQRQEAPLVSGDVNLPADQPTPVGAVPGLTQPGERGVPLDPNAFNNLGAAQQVGTGLLASKQTPEDLAAFKSGMLGLGFTGADATSAVKPITDDITAKAKKGIARGSFKDSKEQLTAFNQIQNSFEKNIKGDRAAMTQFKSATDLVERRGGFDNMTAQDDVALITSFAKMLRPNEAVMADDIENIMKSSGYPDILDALISAKGGKSLAGPVRQNVYSAMTNAFDTLKPLYDQKREQTGQLFDAAGFTKDIPRVVGNPIVGKDFKPYGGGVVAGSVGAPANAPTPPPGSAEATTRQLRAAAALKLRQEANKR